MNFNLMQIHEEAQLMAAACPDALENLIISCFRAGRMTECDIYMFYSPSRWVVTSDTTDGERRYSEYICYFHALQLYAEDERIAQEERSHMKAFVKTARNRTYPNVDTLFPRARGKQSLVLCGSIGHNREVLDTNNIIRQVWVPYPDTNAIASVTVESPLYQVIDGAESCRDTKTW